ncbi:MAG: DUF1553 domain-containing protein [Fuerstiella sp.]|nr:DUF1553 domain-containing protein [Fuerstiella sp.]
MTRRICAVLTSFVVLFHSAGFASENKLLPADTLIQDAIDHYLQMGIAKNGISAVTHASDETILRRTTLDLAGRIPTRPEQEWYKQRLPDERREQLVDRLLSLPDAAYHQANEIDSHLLSNSPYNGEFREYLLWATKEKRSWDQMFRDMLLAKPEEGPLQGATQFLRTRIREVDDLTNDTAILFLGINVSCAKCHDHPLVDDWKQDHFYGMQAFFSRTYQTKKNVVAEKFFDEVKFKTTEGEDKLASFMFLTGDVVPDATPEFSDEARKELEEKIRKAEREDDSEAPVPDFSPRMQLVDIALRDDHNAFFAKNIVNRVWARMLGTGLVTPLDQMHSGNPPSHPELLAWLARDLKQNGYDLNRLIRGVALCEAYAGDSEWTSAAEPPQDQYFAVARTRPLTHRQLALSLQVASTSPVNWPAAEASDEWTQKRESLENRANGWARDFEQPKEDFQIAVDEALFFSNNARVYDDVLRDSGDRLIGHLKAFEDDAQLVAALWEAVLSRIPDEEERNAAVAWLQRENEDRVEKIRQLSWTLLAGPEFRFNH